MRAVCHKDRKALSILYIKYATQVKSYVAFRVGSVTDTEDTVHEVFLQIWQGKGHYDSSKGVEPYIFGIARNMIRKYQREKEKSPQTMPTDSLNGLFPRYRIRESNDPGGKISAQQFKKFIEVIQTELSLKAREAVRLRFVEGLSPKEAAKKTGCSISAFYKRLEKAERAIREALKNKKD
jgi:RNA polymerase sigma-70 factor (ECF subfamily)